MIAVTRKFYLLSMQTTTINKIKFSVACSGQVSSSDFDNLGNIEDCTVFAEMILEIFDTLNPNCNL